MNEKLFNYLVEKVEPGKWRKINVPSAVNDIRLMVEDFLEFGKAVVIDAHRKNLKIIEFDVNDETLTPTLEIITEIQEAKKNKIVPLGALFNEIQESTKLDPEKLAETLAILETMGKIKYFETINTNRIYYLKEK